MTNDFLEKARSVNQAFASLSGLEYLQHIMANGDNSPMAETMNMRLVAVSDGRVEIEGVPAEKFYNPMMRVHGGFAATLIDSALGCAVLTKLPKGSGAGTVSLSVSFVRKIEVATGPLITTATALHVGRTMLTAEAKVADRSGVLYAHGIGNFLVYPA